MAGRTKIEFCNYSFITSVIVSVVCEHVFDLYSFLCLVLKPFYLQRVSSEYTGLILYLARRDIVKGKGRF
jgi:hypothetical protein